MTAPAETRPGTLYLELLEHEIVEAAPCMWNDDGGPIPPCENVARWLLFMRDECAHGVRMRFPGVIIAICDHHRYQIEHPWQFGFSCSACDCPIVSASHIAHKIDYLNRPA